VKVIWIIFILDIFWSAAGFAVDIPKLSNIPAYLWPFVLICPIYPLLLALIWYMYIKKRPINQYLLSFATLPSIVFGVLAVVFYPTAMIYQGTSLRDIGQIFWVLFYAVQGLYLFEKNKFSALALFIPSLYLIIKLYLDIRYGTFGYLDVEGIESNSLLALFLGALIFVIFVAGWKLFREHLDKTN